MKLKINEIKKSKDNTDKNKSFFKKAKDFFVDKKEKIKKITAGVLLGATLTFYPGYVNTVYAETSVKEELTQKELSNILNDINNNDDYSNYNMQVIEGGKILAIYKKDITPVNEIIYINENNNTIISSDNNKNNNNVVKVPNTTITITTEKIESIEDEANKNPKISKLNVWCIGEKCIGIKKIEKGIENGIEVINHQKIKRCRTEEYSTKICQEIYIYPPKSEVIGWTAAGPIVKKNNPATILQNRKKINNCSEPTKSTKEKCEDAIVKYYSTEIYGSSFFIFATKKDGGINYIIGNREKENSEVILLKWNNEENLEVIELFNNNDAKNIINKINNLIPSGTMDAFFNMYNPLTNKK
ncbi:MAG: hypothetical protein QXF70_02590 [Candidatus Bilamarchaeaceae archaeon]